MMPPTQLNARTNWLVNHRTWFFWLFGVGLAIVGWATLGSGETGTKLHVLLQDNRATTYGVIAGLAGSMLGFVLAAAAILATIQERPAASRLARDKAFPKLWEVYIDATKTLALLTVVALAALVGDRDATPFPIAPYAVGALCVVAICQVAFSIWVLERLVAGVRG